MDRAVALELIEELDCAGEDEEAEKEDQELKRIKKLDDQEEKWLRDFINMHPVFEDVPQRIKDAVRQEACNYVSWDSRGE